MKRCRTRWLHAVSLLPVAFAIGCVSLGTHEIATRERDEAQAENARLEKRVQLLEASNESLSAERIALIDDMETLREARAEMERDVRRLKRTEAELSETLAAREAELSVTAEELARISGTYEGLVSDLEAEVASGQIQIEQLRDGLRLNVSQSILFPSGSSTLNSQGVQVLSRVAERLGELPNHVEVQGHTDDVAVRGPSSNWELAAARSAQVVRLFADRGVDPKRLTVVSYGEYAPVASNETPEGRAQNRRIEIRLKPAGVGMQPDPDAEAAASGDS